ncbi:MAG TPA: hypothetical protein VN622_15515 [Clostridia bacterium]|nr:hypothetical protein [Clostridia bacterium]
MPILVIALAVALIFLVMGVLGISAVISEQRQERRADQQASKPKGMVKSA